MLVKSLQGKEQRQKNVTLEPEWLVFNGADVQMPVTGQFFKPQSTALPGFASSFPSRWYCRMTKADLPCSLAASIAPVVETTVQANSLEEAQLIANPDDVNQAAVAISETQDLVPPAEKAEAVPVSQQRLLKKKRRRQPRAKVDGLKAAGTAAGYAAAGVAAAVVMSALVNAPTKTSS